MIAELHPIEHELLPEAVRVIAHGAVASIPANPRRVWIAGRVGAAWTRLRHDRRRLAAAGEVHVRGHSCRCRTRPGSSSSPAGSPSSGSRSSRPAAPLGSCRGGIQVRSITDLTGFPEIMDGRVKTLHPKLYAGLLAVRDDAEHMRRPSEHEVEFVDLVCVNLYPFERTVAQRGVDRRRGDREHRHRRSDDDPRRCQELAYAAPVVSPESYDAVLDELREIGRRLSLADAREPGLRGVRLHGPL